MFERFLHNPIEWTITICLVAIMGSCTARSVYCDWAECKHKLEAGLK